MVPQCHSHWCCGKELFNTPACQWPISPGRPWNTGRAKQLLFVLQIAQTHRPASGSSSTTRCWKASRPWRSRRSWRVAWHKARTYPDKWHWSPRDPAAGHSSCQACWTSSLRSPYRLVGCWCRILQEDRQILPSWTLACPWHKLRWSLANFSIFLDSVHWADLPKAEQNPKTELLV